MTKINSGGAAGSASAAGLNAPEQTDEADDAKPGKDTTYQAEPYDPKNLKPPSKKFKPTEPPEVEKETSWVEIEMVDEDGEPWADEYYEVTLPDGKVRKGRLDDNGQAHVLLPTKTATDVSFPRLDAEAWERRS